MKQELEHQKKEQVAITGKYLYNFGTATEKGVKAILQELRMD